MRKKREMSFFAADIRMSSVTIDRYEYYLRLKKCYVTRRSENEKANNPQSDIFCIGYVCIDGTWI